MTIHVLTNVLQQIVYIYFILTGLVLHKDRLAYRTNSMHTVMRHHAKTQINHPFS